MSDSRPTAASLQLAEQLDLADPLARFRDEFYLPPGVIYLDGNSLGPLSRPAQAALDSAVTAWQQQGITAWLDAPSPWYDLTVHVSEQLAPLVGADPLEIVVANSTTVNLHQLLSSFYSPSLRRNAILIDELAFPTDRYAVDSHLRLRGQDVRRSRRVVRSRDGKTLAEGDIIAAFSDSVQLAILPSVIFTSGQLLDVPLLISAAHDHGIIIGFDCSHSVGVVPHQLSEWDADFAFFCTYKYLNGGPGSPAALFLHRRHHDRLPGMAGWFGNRQETQFQMSPEFAPAPGARGFQLGTPHILSLAPLAGALQTVAEAGVSSLRAKSLSLTSHLRQWIQEAWPAEECRFADPPEPARRGGHVALIHPEAGAISRALRQNGVIVDFRPPDILRLAPAPLYTRFIDCWRTAQLSGELLRHQRYRSLASTQDRIP